MQIPIMKGPVQKSAITHIDFGALDVPRPCCWIPLDDQVGRYESFIAGLPGTSCITADLRGLVEGPSEMQDLFQSGALPRPKRK